MTTTTRLAAYAVALAATFAVANGIGRAVGPVGSPPEQHGGTTEQHGGTTEQHGAPRIDGILQRSDLSTVPR